MSSLIRMALLLSALALVLLMVYRPRRAQGFFRRVRIVGYAYVAAVLISALLRVTGIVDWGG